MDEMYKRFAVIDSEIVYYGTINLLSNVKEDDSLVRLKDKTLVQEILID